MEKDHQSDIIIRYVVGNRIQLRDLFLDHAEVLGLHVKQYTWIDEWFPGFHDFEISIKIDGKSFGGRAIDADPDLAFIKAGAEAAERATCYANRLATTSGSAVHSVIDLAASNASTELIERDSFFCHYLTKQPFYRVPQRLMAGLGWDHDRLIATLASRRVTLDIGCMQSLPGLMAVCCAVNGFEALPPFGLRIGLGCDPDFQVALQKALFEAIRSMIGPIEGQPFIAKSVASFMSQSQYQSSDHADLGLDLDAAAPTVRLFSTATTEWSEERCFEFDPEIVVSSLKMPASIQNLGLVAVVATSNKLQKGYVGRIWPKKVNLHRLRKFSRSQLEFSSVEHSPHIFG